MRFKLRARVRVEPVRQGFDQESSRNQCAGLRLGKAALTQVEDGVFVQLSGRIAFGSLKIVSLELKVGLGEDFRAFFEQQRVVRHLRIGFLRRTLNLEAALKDAAPPLSRNAADELADLRAFRLKD